MCGIFGFLARQRIPEEDGIRLLRRATDVIVHRGPDDNGSLFVSGNRLLLDGEVVSDSLASQHPSVGLGHARLSIIDLSPAGRQPLANEDGTIWITYNGEIYNFQEIRIELERIGHVFRSRTDTEVVVHAYEEWGADCLKRFNGMFAFAIYDLRNQTLFAARDRLGIKPFYWSTKRDGRQLAFGSEVKSLLQVDWICAEADWDGLLGHLLFLWSPEPKTAFKGIEKLPAGHYLLWHDGRLKVHPYWDAALDSKRGSGGEAVCLDRLDRLLRNSVERRMISDVPVGCLLSGGLDSSLISALMTQINNGPISTYTIAFSEQDKAFEAMPDDQRHANRMVGWIGSDHHEILIRPDISDLLPRLIWHLEEPIADPAAINTYLICRAAREHGTKVLLSGMGADEVFGGYRKHLSVLLARLYKRMLPAWAREGLIRRFVDTLSVSDHQGGRLYARWGKRFLKSASLPDLECFIGNSAYYNHSEVNELLHPDFQVAWERTYPIQRHYEHYASVRSRDLVSQMTYLDTKLFLPSLNLAYTDKSSMAASVEERVPFVDHELVAFGLNLDSRKRIRAFTQKHILKKLAERYLPREVIYRPKAPFGAPLRSWMRRDLHGLVTELLSEENVRRRGYFRYGAIKKMIDQNRSGQQDYAHRLWGLLTIELWHRIFIDRDYSATTLSETDAALSTDIRKTG